MLSSVAVDATFVAKSGFWDDGEGRCSPFRMSPFIQVQCILQNKGAFITTHSEFRCKKKKKYLWLLEPLKSLTFVDTEMEVLVRSAINRDVGLGTPQYSESCSVIATPLFQVPEANTH